MRTVGGGRDGGGENQTSWFSMVNVHVAVARVVTKLNEGTSSAAPVSFSCYFFSSPVVCVPVLQVKSRTDTLAHGQHHTLSLFFCAFLWFAFDFGCVPCKDMLNRARKGGFNKKDSNKRHHYHLIPTVLKDNTGITVLLSGDQQMDDWFVCVRGLLGCGSLVLCFLKMFTSCSGKGVVEKWSTDCT